ncbi:hypothetical protein D3C85_1681340 [compost metagenome]
MASSASLVTKDATRVLGFFSTRISICLTLGSVVAAPSGTTAPFSAISGAVSVTSLLSTGAAAPRAFITSATDLASKADLL